MGEGSRRGAGPAGSWGPARADGLPYVAGQRAVTTLRYSVGPGGSALISISARFTIVWRIGSFNDSGRPVTDAIEMPSALLACRLAVKGERYLR